MKYEKNLKMRKIFSVPSICLLNYIGKLHECRNFLKGNEKTEKINFYLV